MSFSGIASGASSSILGSGALRGVPSGNPSGISRHISSYIRRSILSGTPSVVVVGGGVEG